MSFAKKYNNNSVENLFNIDTTGYDYKKLSDLDVNDIYTLKGMFISSKSKFGSSPVAVLDGFYVNLPSHLLETTADILKDDEAIEEINNNKVGIQVYKYYSTTYKKECYSIKFIDIE